MSDHLVNLHQIHFYGLCERCRQISFLNSKMISDKGGEKLCHVEMELDQWEWVP